MAFQILRKGIARLLLLIVVASLVSGCAPGASAETFEAQVTPTTEIAHAAETPSISQQNAAVTAVPDNPTPSPSTPASPLLWISPALPRALQDQIRFPKDLPTTSNRSTANLWFEIPQDGQAAGEEKVLSSTWVYALAAPFPTITDEVEMGLIESAWQGRSPKELGSRPLLMTAETLAVFQERWGPPGKRGVKVITNEKLLDAAWETQAYALIPFEEIQPRWKILRVGGQSPLEKNFSSSRYPLTIPIWLHGSADAWPANLAELGLPSNRAPSKLTVLTMTGVTALSRHIGERMESKGLTYPAQDIGAWLAEADLTHISNEVSFYENCPKPGPDRADMRFCSSPRYIALLEEVGADIIELTGNHILDWGVQPFLYSLEMYHQRGWLTYGGGVNLQDSLQPAAMEHNGNRLAFIGCSPSGPAAVWARDDRAGSAPCNYERLEETIQALRSQGFLPVVTLQAVETDTYTPAVAQGMPVFRRLARAGAVIVSGSQSHVPQTMTFVENPYSTAFVHYGLGNLFFDQMKPAEARQEFVDRHVFYNGKYLGVELLTAVLEDYARPRPMQKDERIEFLENIFSQSVWTEE